jgi:membrane protein
LSWGELFERTLEEMKDDDCLGLAAQLSYYFFLALFPTFLLVLALASFFPLHNLTDEVVRSLRPIAPEEMVGFFAEQLRRLSDQDSGGLLTLGLVVAIWSSSAALVAMPRHPVRRGAELRDRACLSLWQGARSEGAGTEEKDRPRRRARR